jgi:hypothetical protein
MTLSNILVGDLNTTPHPVSATIALGLGGTYDTMVSGLTVTGVVDYGVYVTAGESAFYKMWPKQVPAMDRTITLRNIVVSQARKAALDLEGAGSFTGGYLGTYLRPPRYGAVDQTDKLNYVVDKFNLAAAHGTSSAGIFTSARSVDIHNGTLSGFDNAIVVTQDCAIVHIENIQALNSHSQAIKMDLGGGLWSPPRLKTGYVKDSLITVNGATTRRSYGITLNWASDFLIENNTFKSSSGFDPGSLGGVFLFGSSVQHVFTHNNHLAH